MRTSLRFVVPAGLLIVTAASIGIRLNAAPADLGWDAKAAATYLDGRAEWWSTWPNAARDRGTLLHFVPYDAPLRARQPVVARAARRA